MNKLFVILIAISFYLPETTQILDFSQCIFYVFTTNNGNVCDCINITNANNATQKNQAAVPHNHKHIDLKQVDKFCSNLNFEFSNSTKQTPIKKYAIYISLITQKHLQQVFRPPITNYM